MHSKLHILTLAALLLASTLVHTATAHACKCAQPPAPAVAAASAAAVFEGHVTEVIAGEAPTDPMRVRLHVVRSFKGADSEQLELLTPSSSAACGYGFEVGKSYLVYAGTDEDEALRTNLCSRTRPVADAAEDVAELGMGATPVDPKGPGATPDEPEKQQPANGGCASCTITRNDPRAAWPLLLALGWLARRRRTPA